MMSPTDHRDPTALALEPENYVALLKRPLLALPVEVRPACLSLWACHQHLFPSALPIAGAVAAWIGQHGLDPADAADVLRRLMAPGRMGSFKFAADLMTALANEVQELINRRRLLAEQQARRQQAESGDRAAPDEVRRLLASVTRPVGGEGGHP